MASLKMCGLLAKNSLYSHFTAGILIFVFVQTVLLTLKTRSVSFPFSLVKLNKI